MKKILIALLCCLLLIGCAPRQSTPETTESILPEATSPPEGFYDPDSAAEAASGGALRCYPLGDTIGSGILALNDSLLLFASDDQTTTLTVLSGAERYPSASIQLDFGLFPEDSCLRRWKNGISFYDPTTEETVVLDEQLREVSRINAPADMIGTPLLSYDRSTLYYCTANALRALDLDSGISRLLKEMAYETQDISALLLNDSVVACSVSRNGTWEMLYISSETGLILEQRDELLIPQTAGDRYYAALYEGADLFHVFGDAEGERRLLNLRQQNCATWFLPETYGLLCVSTENEHTLVEYYDLESCLRTAALELNITDSPWSFVCTDDGLIWFLCYDPENACTVLYSWDPSLSPTDDTTFYGGTYYTREEPDLAELEACKLYAAEIGEKYGIEVLVYKDATLVQPYDYDLEYEHLTGVLKRELELLDRNLGRYPEGFIQTLADRFDGLRICIVRSLTGTAEAGSLDSADGIQFMDGFTACIALAASGNTEYALYHEMCHLIDTMVISESGAYDRWDQLNPKDFTYDYDYITNQSRDGSQWLQEQNRSFIDTYSMSFPKEDRARIMEYAMTEGNEAYFRSTTMQSKLKLLCEGIREAFGLRKSTETFLWEQYLNTSLAYTEK